MSTDALFSSGSSRIISSVMGHLPDESCISKAHTRSENFSSEDSAAGLLERVVADIGGPVTLTQASGPGETLSGATRIAIRRTSRRELVRLEP